MNWRKEKMKNIELSNSVLLKEGVNARAKDDLKNQFYQLEALSRLDPWDIVNVLEELKREFNQY